MEIQVVTVCYNEGRRIYEFLDHYWKLGVDKITVYDNMSTDDTLLMIENFNQTVENIVTVIPYDTNGEIRDDVYLEIKNNAWKSIKSDWVIVVDCDEFLEIHPNQYSDCEHRDKLKILLDDYNQCGFYIPTVRGVQVVTDKFEDLNDESISKYVLDPTFNKSCIFNRNMVEVKYTPGCHGYSFTGTKGLHIRWNDNEGYPLFLFHYKHIDIEYVINRYEEFNSRLSAFNKRNKFGVQYQMDANGIRNKFAYYKRFAMMKGDLFRKYEY